MQHISFLAQQQAQQQQAAAARAAQEAQMKAQREAEERARLEAEKARNRSRSFDAANESGTVRQSQEARKSKKAKRRGTSRLRNALTSGGLANLGIGQSAGGRASGLTIAQIRRP